jgi:predicted Zn-dependent protease
MVLRVGSRLATLANRPNYQWDFRLFASPEQNAFALPGGKVAVYEGLMSICQNEAGLATVMSHEVAHVLARHGSERISQQAAVQGLQSVVGYALQGSSPMNRDLILRAYGAGSQVGLILPHSRRHELEADTIGLRLMAEAGYDPSEAVRFWQRFADVQSPSSVSPLFSTHPSDAQRASELSAMLPTALTIYNASPIRVGLGEIV